LFSFTFKDFHAYTSVEEISPKENFMDVNLVALTRLKFLLKIFPTDNSETPDVT
jgi:hypothetical protein